MRKPGVNQIEDKTTASKCSSTDDTPRSSFLIPTTAGIPVKITTTATMNIEIIDTPFDPENIIIQVTNQQPDQLQNTWRQETLSHQYSSQEAGKLNGFLEECKVEHVMNGHEICCSSRLQDVDKDPFWSVFGDQQDNSVAHKTIKKHRGRVNQVDLDKIQDEQQKKNIKRSRNYRVEKRYEEK